jgi:hypothetical protein
MTGSEVIGSSGGDLHLWLLFFGVGVAFQKCCWLTEDMGLEFSVFQTHF